MIIRKIRPEELKRTLELFAIAFEFGNDIDKSPEELVQEIKENPKSREEVFWSERWAAFEDDDKTMMSYLIAQPFPVNFDGQIYTMTGIGGVASLPQYRRKGGVRGCFEAALPEMYRGGITFSYLYPFSTVYYRKFGYEIGCEKIQYHVRLNSMKHFEVSGNSYLVEPSNLMLSDIKSVYQKWQNKYNMMVVNEEYEYAWVEKSNPVKDQIFTYVYKDSKNAPLGYMSLKQVNEKDGRNIQCTRINFVNAEGLKGLLNILISMGSDHTYATLELPKDIDMTMIFPEWSMGAVSATKIISGMVRVVNAESVLKGAKYRGSGMVMIQLDDKQIQENCGIFVVTFQRGKAVSVIKDNAVCPDISLGINEFSRLMIGACDVKDLEYMSNVKIHNVSTNFEQIFYKKPNLILENF